MAHTEGHQGGQALKAGAARHHHIDERLEEQRAALNERPSDRHRRRTEHQNGHKTHDAEGDGDAIQLRYGEGRPLSRQGHERHGGDAGAKSDATRVKAVGPLVGSAHDDRGHHVAHKGRHGNHPQRAPRKRM